MVGDTTPAFVHEPGARSVEPETVEINLRGQPLDLAATLGCGQTFRWHASNRAWQGVAGHRAWRLRLDDDKLLVHAWPPTGGHDVRGLIERYFALDVDWREIGRHVAASHPDAAAAVYRFPGLRVIRQDFEETLLSFCAATASSVPRITRNVRLLSEFLGNPIPDAGGVHSFDFPSAFAIAEAPHELLATGCNLAYRADHLQRVASVVCERGSGWLARVSELPYREAHAELDALAHIGPKLADCICLIGLHHWEAVPV